MHRNLLPLLRTMPQPYATYLSQWSKQKASEEKSKTLYEEKIRFYQFVNKRNRAIEQILAAAMGLSTRKSKTLYEEKIRFYHFVVEKNRIIQQKLAVAMGLSDGSGTRSPLKSISLGTVSRSFQ
uniref:Uncharacterized protein n=1 Tax=Romanomermis culicivorax TaxID=13658 RepID=A0A915HHG1_ROMCU